MHILKCQANLFHPWINVQNSKQDIFLEKLKKTGKKIIHELKNQLDPANIEIEDTKSVLLRHI